MEWMQARTGRWPVLLCADTDDVCRHLSWLDAEAGREGDAPSIIPGGVWIYRPVGHFLMPYSQVDTLDGALAHELVHAALRDLPTPLWVEEGLATGVETAMGHRPHPFSALEDIQEFREFREPGRRHGRLCHLGGDPGQGAEAASGSARPGSADAAT